jgi:hypothetical protein
MKCENRNVVTSPASVDAPPAWSLLEQPVIAIEAAKNIPRGVLIFIIESFHDG